MISMREGDRKQEVVKINKADIIWFDHRYNSRPFVKKHEECGLCFVICITFKILLYSIMIHFEEMETHKTGIKVLNKGLIWLLFFFFPSVARKDLFKLYQQDMFFALKCLYPH